MEKILNRKKMRLQDFDYSSVGAYFITICTKNRGNFFGKIVNDEMILNKSGEILKNVWENLSKHYESCVLDEYIVMPNHFHGIIFLRNVVGDGFKPSHKIYPISEIIRGLKTFSSRNINLHLKEEFFKRTGLKPVPTENMEKFQWQRSFHDRIIRDDEELKNITEYIKMNPENWEKDENFMVL
jgi:REP element-mobilizing transposase RayT